MINALILPGVTNSRDSHPWDWEGAGREGEGALEVYIGLHYNRQH